MSRIRSFRGQLPAASSESIPLHTNNGLTGYTIKDIKIIQKSPGALNCEGLVVIWKIPPTTAEITATTIDLSDNRILAVGFYSGNVLAQSYPEDMTIIFDNEIFNQDIYITYQDVSTVNDAMNYYIELEQMDLALDEATVATLKDIRNTGSQ